MRSLVPRCSLKPPGQAHLAAIARANVRLLSMAGNHIADCGAIGIADTIAALDRLGIAHAGADRDHAAAAAPAIVVCDVCRITLLSDNCVGPQIAWADEHRANGVTAGCRRSLMRGRATGPC